MLNMEQLVKHTIETWQIGNIWIDSCTCFRAWFYGPYGKKNGLTGAEDADVLVVVTGVGVAPCGVGAVDEEVLSGVTAQAPQPDGGARVAYGRTVHPPLLVAQLPTRHGCRIEEGFIEQNLKPLFH